MAAKKKGAAKAAKTTKAAAETTKGPCAGISRQPADVYERTVTEMFKLQEKLERTAVHAEKLDDKKLAKKIRGTQAKLSRVVQAA